MRLQIIKAHNPETDSDEGTYAEHCGLIPSMIPVSIIDTDAEVIDAEFTTADE